MRDDDVGGVGLNPTNNSCLKYLFYFNFFQFTSIQ